MQQDLFNTDKKPILEVLKPVFPRIKHKGGKNDTSL